MHERTCTASFVDMTGIRHTATVKAQSVFEAAAQAIRIFSECLSVDASVGPTTTLSVTVMREEETTHAVSVRNIVKWAQEQAKDPVALASRKSKVRELIGSNGQMPKFERGWRRQMG